MVTWISVNLDDFSEEMKGIILDDIQDAIKNRLMTMREIIKRKGGV